VVEATVEMAEAVVEATVEMAAICATTAVRCSDVRS